MTDGWRHTPHGGLLQRSFPSDAPLPQAFWLRAIIVLPWLAGCIPALVIAPPGYHAPGTETALRLSFRSELTATYRLTRVKLYLDGAVAFDKVDGNAELHAVEGGTVSEFVIDAGTHLIDAAFIMTRRDEKAMEPGEKRYLVLHRYFRFDCTLYRWAHVRARVFEQSDPKLSYMDKPGIDFEVVRNTRAPERAPLSPVR